MDAINIGNKIAILRKNKGWAQKQLADQLFVTDKDVSKWELELNFPDLSIMEPLSNLLDITVPQLLGMEQNSEEETIAVVTKISTKEKEKLKRDLRRMVWITIIVAGSLCVTEIKASYIFDQHDLYGLPQALTSGMLGWIGMIIGNVIYTLRNYRKL